MLAVQESSALEGFELMGVIKETGVDDEGLSDFYFQYFPFPIYRDVDLKFYEAFGNGSLLDGISWNPLKWWGGFKELSNRMKEKKIEGNLKGEGIVTGGLLIFGPDGKVKYMYKEQPGIPFDEGQLLAAVKDVRETHLYTSTATAEL